MKKIILSTASLLLLAAATYAQTINQVGAQQLAFQEQTGNNQTSVINQVQAENNASRTNYGNYAITYQGIPNNTGPNTATINQNSGSQGNRAGISQGGGANIATINQNGGPEGISGGAVSASATLNGAAENGNFAGILQQGVYNTATLSQENNSSRNTAEIYQNGNADEEVRRNEATIRQSNNSSGNIGLIFQGYFAQNVIIGPVSNAKAGIFQGKEPGETSIGPPVPESINNVAKIAQLADNTSAGIVQGQAPFGRAGRAANATANIVQAGPFNQASIYQGSDASEAVGSTAAVLQFGQNRKTVYNIADIKQGGGPTGRDVGSTASVRQYGEVGRNGVLIFQGNYGSSNYATADVSQGADAQTVQVDIFQGNGAGSVSTSDKAIVSIGGRSNRSKIVQNSTQFENGQSRGGDNTAQTIQMNGVAGSAVYINQGAASANEQMQANRNSATITQATGSNLRASINQAQTWVFTPSALNTPRVDNTEQLVLTIVDGVPVSLGLIANDNKANILQLGGASNFGYVYQSGEFNSVDILQQGGTDGRALVVQTDNSQRAQAVINQTSTGARNRATIYQFRGGNADGEGGFGNQAIIDQVAGSDNFAFARQGAPGASVGSNDNFIRITQNGNGNQARMAQIGNNNYADITQNGNGNQLTDATGTAGTFAIQQGNNNRLILTQTAGEGSGSGYTFTYTQIGDNNTQVVTQPMGN